MSAAPAREGPRVVVEPDLAIGVAAERLVEDVLPVDRGGRAGAGERLELGAVVVEARQETGPEPGPLLLTAAPVDLGEPSRRLLVADLLYRPAEPGDGGLLVPGLR